MAKVDIPYFSYLIVPEMDELRLISLQKLESRGKPSNWWPRGDSPSMSFSLRVRSFLSTPLNYKQAMKEEVSSLAARDVAALDNGFLPS